MTQLERLCRLKQYFDDGRCIDKYTLMREFEISAASLKRDLAFLRDRMNAPIVFDRSRGGYHLDQTSSQVGRRHELPGLWLNAHEIEALLTLQHLLDHLDAGALLGPHIQRFSNRIAKLLDDTLTPASNIRQRIRLHRMAARPLPLPCFQAVASALLRRKRLDIHYYGRSRDSVSQREISPQRLIHYRDNWYLDAWCHVRDALRSFSVDAIQKVRTLDESAIDIDETTLNAALGAGYGIFAGDSVQWAILRFSAERARWVATERWHPQQEGSFTADGSYELRLPYTNPTELIGDIMRHVPAVEVLQPAELREAVVQRLAAAYRKMSGGSFGELGGG